MTAHQANQDTYHHLTGSAVRRIRHALGLSQRQMAGQLRYGKTYLSSIETGALKMTRRFRARFAETFPRGSLPKPDRSGWIYILKTPRLGGIGSTRAPSRMQSALERALPIEFVMHVWPVDDTAKVLAVLRLAYKNQHSHGRWYRMTDLDLLEIGAMLGR